MILVCGALYRFVLLPHPMTVMEQKPLVPTLVSSCCSFCTASYWRLGGGSGYLRIWRSASNGPTGAFVGGAGPYVGIIQQDRGVVVRDVVVRHFYQWQVGSAAQPWVNISKAGKAVEKAATNTAGA